MQCSAGKPLIQEWMCLSLNTNLCSEHPCGPITLLMASTCSPAETLACCHFREISQEKSNERDRELKELTCPQNLADPNFHCVSLGCALKILIHAGPTLDQTWVLRPIQTKMTISPLGHQECHKMCCPGLSGISYTTGIVFFCLPFVHSTRRRFNNGCVAREITPIGSSA